MVENLAHLGSVVTDIPFTHQYATVSGIRLHYVTGGSGDLVVLLPGWPQTWYAWRKVMPILARHYRVVAVDLRGMGDSDKPETGYDACTAARDVRELVSQLGAERFFLVGHDVGSWVAYAYATLFPETLRRLVILDAALVGLTSEQAFQLSRNSRTWQFYFHSISDLPEALIEGREELYLSWFFRTKATQPNAIEPEDLQEYLRCYSAPNAMRCGFEYYRAITDNLNHNQAAMQTKLKMPVLAFGGETATGMGMFKTMQAGAEDVSGGVISNCGHYIPEECPDYLGEQILQFFGKEL